MSARAPSSTPGIAEALARLYALAPRGARYDLGPMRQACALEGDPQDAFRSVHVAGTNGKGSVCAMVASITRAAGLKVGLFTSPHLCRFAERIQIDGEPVTDERLAAALTGVMDRHPSLTFFEVTTLAAFEIFRDARLDLVVLEVGLGGRLDATNVVTPVMTAITTIGIDHVDYLGTTIESIAFEKAGICKRGVPLVVGRIDAVAAKVIEARAREVEQVRISRLGHDFVGARQGETLTVYRTDGSEVVEIHPALIGPHQDDNALVATEIAWQLPGPNNFRVSDPAVQRGISEARWPGRLESIDAPKAPFIGRYLLDGAHNEAGVEALSAALSMMKKSGALVRSALVFGAMADKPWATMLARLAPLFDAVIVVQPSASGAGRRGVSADEILARTAGVTPSASIEEALGVARRLGGDDATVVVAGSLYLVGEARALLLGVARDPQVGL